MLSYRLLPLLLLFSLAGKAQKTETLLDLKFKPTPAGGRYYAVTEKVGDKYHRLAYFVPEGNLALDAWYTDAEATIPDGKEIKYHPTRFPSTVGTYIGGKKDGPWLGYTDEGGLRDSFTYAKGFYSGAQFSWNKEGWLTDSAQFDGAGNGVWVSWNNGVLSSAGRYVRDTAKTGRWTYYHPNGQKMATQDYIGDKDPVCHCWDSTGVELAAMLCEEKEADFPGGGKAWSRFLSTHLDPEVPGRNGARSGQYLVVVQFIVDKNGAISDIQPKSHQGFGMEEEMVRIMKASPKWIPTSSLGGQ